MSASNLLDGGGGDGTRVNGNLDLSHKSHDPPQRCEVKVDVKEDGHWVRIPVTLCELWINKDGPADVTRTAKVKFPTEWGGESIAKYINGFSGEGLNSYDECRVWFWDHDDEQYQISQYGYIGGVGPAAENGVMKMWVYDPADLMRGIQVSTSFNEPTIQDVIDFAIRGVDDNGNPVGIELRSVFDDVKVYVTGLREVELQKKDQREFGTSEPEEGEFTYTHNTAVGSFQINLSDLVDDIADALFGSEQTSSIFSKKHFQVNRHNMVDLMNWFAAEIGAKWHFEPTPDGPVLFFDNTSSRGIEDADGDFSRRVFIDDELDEGEALTEVDVAQFTDQRPFDTVDVHDNSALYDIKPFNTIYLYGESPSSLDILSSEAMIGGNRGQQFPFVKATYEPLLERAGGYEYAAPAVESDAVWLDQAEAKAKKEVRKHLEEATEGKITLKGEPYIAPYDYIRTIPTCNDTYQNIEETAITYEVNGVKHRRAADERYETELGVSLVFDESLLNIESEYKDA